jgi:hypothetical protein
LSEGRQEAIAAHLGRLAREQRRHTWLLAIIALLLALTAFALLQFAP